MEASELILIPHDRIGALIGVKGATRKEIEKLTETGIEVDSENGEVEINQKGDAIKYWRALRIVKAIARGFSPEHAYKLLDDDCLFELIELSELLGKNASRLKAKKGRVIGAHGRAREEIERDTGAMLSVYGKTIGIIGKEEEVAKAKRAVEMLLGGATHTSAYDYLRRGQERSRRFEL